MILKELNKFY